jgi:hypothetical protein
VVEPAPATFAVVATGVPAPTYQWQASADGGATWGDLPGATAPTYTTGPTATAQSGTLYRARVRNETRTPPAGTVAHVVLSSGAALTVSPDLPPNALLARAVTAGYRSSFAIGLDDTLWAWGENVDSASGQYAADSARWATRPVQVRDASGAPLADVAAFAQAGGIYSASYALQRDGSVSAWGQNGAGQLGDGTTLDHAAPAKVRDGTAALDRACAIAASASVLAVIRSDEADGACGPGKAKRAWIAGLIDGSSWGGQPAGGRTDNGAIIVPVPGLPAGVPVNAVASMDAAGASGALLLFLENGQVFAWGWGWSN